MQATLRPHTPRRGREMQVVPKCVCGGGGEVGGEGNLAFKWHFQIIHALSPLTDKQKLTPELRESFVC